MKGHIRWKIIYLCVIILCILSQTVFSKNLEREKIFERFMQSQKTKKRFRAKVELKHGVPEEIGPLVSSSTEHLLDVDLEQKILYSLRERKSSSFFGQSMEEMLKAPLLKEDFGKRELYLLDQMLYYKWQRKWTKYPNFSYYASTFWRMMELIQVGGFYDRKTVEGLKPSLDDTIYYPMTFSDHIDEDFGPAFRIFFLGLNYTDISDIGETNLGGAPCYLLKVEIPEDNVRKFLEQFAVFTDESFGSVIIPPKLIVEVFISKNDYSLLAVQYDKYKTKGWMQFPEGNEKLDFSVSEKISFEYPTIPLELPVEVKNADIKE